MKMITLFMRQKPSMCPLITSLLLTSLSSATGFCDTENISQAGNQTTTPLAINQMVAAENPAQRKHAPVKQKKILLNSSRGLSAFFIIGIALNIIMATTFAWWFSKEWRRSKKMRPG